MKCLTKPIQHMNKSILLSAIVTSMLTVSCGNKMKPMEQHFYADQPAVEQAVEDSAAAPIKDEAQPSEDKSSAPAHSYSPSVPRSDETGHIDNMRGFDPASEDDMDDNGMSRYMENNDEEGWD